MKGNEGKLTSASHRGLGEMVMEAGLENLGEECEEGQNFPGTVRIISTDPRFDKVVFW